MWQGGSAQSEQRAARCDPHVKFARVSVIMFRLESTAASTSAKSTVPEPLCEPTQLTPHVDGLLLTMLQQVCKP
jgi:hypothetical protein